MASVKKILKRTSGVLKKALIFTPLIIGGGSILAAIGTGIAASVISEQAFSGYKETETYQNAVIDDTKELTSKYENGELSKAEFADGMDYFGTDGYIKSIINKEIEGNEKWQGMLKQIDALSIGAISCLGGIALGGASCILWYFKPNIADKLVDSADNDFDWEPPVSDKPKEDTSKDNGKEDISNDEEELGSLDDFLEKFTESK